MSKQNSEQGTLTPEELDQVSSGATPRNTVDGTPQPGDDGDPMPGGGT